MSSSSTTNQSSDWKSNLEEALKQQSRAFFVPCTPRLPSAIPVLNVPNPLLGETLISSLTSQTRPAFCNCDRQAGERCAFCWAWEPSETHSIPTVWSAATSMHTSIVAGSNNSVLPLGQRVLWLKPERVPCHGGTVVISLKREVSQDLWNSVEVRLRSKTEFKVVSLKPDGVRKGKRIAIKVPELSVGDYDVSVHVGATDIPGVLVLEVSKEEVEEQRPDTGCST